MLHPPPCLVPLPKSCLPYVRPSLQLWSPGGLPCFLSQPSFPLPSPCWKGGSLLASPASAGPAQAGACWGCLRQPQHILDSIPFLLPPCKDIKMLLNDCDLSQARFRNMTAACLRHPRGKDRRTRMLPNDRSLRQRKEPGSRQTTAACLCHHHGEGRSAKRPQSVSVTPVAKAEANVAKRSQPVSATFVAKTEANQNIAKQPQPVSATSVAEANQDVAKRPQPVFAHPVAKTEARCLQTTAACLRHPRGKDKSEMSPNDRCLSPPPPWQKQANQQPNDHSLSPPPSTRWSALISFAAARAYASSLLALPGTGAHNLDGPVPDVSDVLGTARVQPAACARTLTVSTTALRVGRLASTATAQVPRCPGAPL